METITKKLYEAMFLVDSAQAGSDWDGTMAVINRVLERADADVVALRKWDDRKLAYDIEHKERGTYILSYFRADGSYWFGVEPIFPGLVVSVVLFVAFSRIVKH